MATKDRLYRLVEELPESEVAAAERYLEYLGIVGDPVLAAFLQAPEEDEPLTPEDEAAIEEAHQAVARGEVEPWERVQTRLLGG